PAAITALQNHFGDEVNVDVTSTSLAGVTFQDQSVETRIMRPRRIRGSEINHHRKAAALPPTISSKRDPDRAALRLALVPSYWKAGSSPTRSCSIRSLRGEGCRDRRQFVIRRRRLARRSLQCTGRAETNHKRRPNPS